MSKNSVVQSRIAASWLYCVTFAESLFSVGSLVAVFATSLNAQGRVSSEILTNQSVIDMVTGKLPREVIVDKIQRTSMKFDVSAPGLLSLHVASVPRQIILVMLDRVVQEKMLIDTLNNANVSAMVNGKLPKEILVAKLQQTPATFDVTSGGLVSLNASKVPKDIITMMMHAPFGPEARVAEPAQPAPTPVQGGPAAMDSVIAAPARDSAIVPAAPKPGSKPAPVAPPPAVRTPKALLSPLPSEPGIHLLAGENELQLLEPTAFTSGRTSNVLASALTSGLAPVKMKAVVSARQAAIRVEDTSAEFYFVFERTSAGLGSSAQGWGTVSSPNEFTLIRLDKKSDRREATTGSFSALGSSTGTESKSIVPTKFTRLKPGVYRVVPLAPLAPGEYAFFPASAYGPNAAGSRLFDFGVDTATSAGVNR